MYKKYKNRVSKLTTVEGTRIPIWPPKKKKLAPLYSAGALINIEKGKKQRLLENEIWSAAFIFKLIDYKNPLTKR